MIKKWFKLVITLLIDFVLVLFWIKEAVWIFTRQAEYGWMYLLGGIEIILVFWVIISAYERSKKLLKEIRGDE